MRPEILFPLFAPIGSLKGVGPRIAPALEKIAGPLVRDLLFLAPHNLVRRPRRTVAEARPEETATVLVTVTDHLKPRSPQQPLRIRASDETGQLDLVYFGNSARGMDGRLPVGARRWVSGRLERFGLDLQMVHPDYVVEESRVGDIPEVETVYPAGGGLAPRLVRRFVLAALERAPDLPEWQDPAWRQGRGFPSWREAIRNLHAPAGEADLSPAAPARSRLAYDELLAHQLAMAQRRAHRRAGAGRPLPASDLAGRVEGGLPFRLTPDQQTSLKEIRDDLASGQRMSRLLQGDVGSGKTVVAMLALADAAAAGAPLPGSRGPSQPVAEAAAAAAFPPAAASAAAPLLLISIGEQPSWIEVLQGNEGLPIHSGLTEARSEHRLLATPPLRVVVGNAASVRLEYRGQVVDLAPHTRAGVARLTIE